MKYAAAAAAAADDDDDDDDDDDNARCWRSLLNILVCKKEMLTLLNFLWEFIHLVF